MTNDLDLREALLNFIMVPPRVYDFSRHDTRYTIVKFNDYDYILVYWDKELDIYYSAQIPEQPTIDFIDNFLDRITIFKLQR